MTETTPSPDPQQTNPPECSEVGPVIPSHELLQGQREIRIEHDGIIYRLRLTRRGKLILQK